MDGWVIRHVRGDRETVATKTRHPGIGQVAGRTYGRGDSLGSDGDADASGLTEGRAGKHCEWGEVEWVVVDEKAEVRKEEREKGNAPNIFGQYRLETRLVLNI